MTTWIVGRGLLGAAVEGAMAAVGPVWRTPAPLGWSEPAVVREQLAAACSAFAAVAGQGPWKVAWCAGAGVTATEPAALGRETELLSAFLGALGRTRLRPEQGVFFLASSAGGVYAGADDPPFTEATPPRPVSPYGRAKREQEQYATAWTAATGVPTLVGRIANLYGPGQNTAKPQGLISQLVLGTLLRRPLPMYVPLDTTRDYLFAPDAAGLVRDALRRLGDERASGGPVVVKILASQRAVTLGMVLAEVRHALKRQPRVVLAASPLGAAQRRDLRLRSIVWPDLDRRPLTSLAEGIHAVAADLLLRFGLGGPSLTARAG